MLQSGLSDNQYRSTLDSLLEGCQILSFDWTYLYLNDAAAKHNRRPNSELLGRTMPECWPGIEQTPVFQMLQKTMSEKVSLHQEIEFQFADQKIGWYDVRSSPVPNGVFVLSLDITERKLHEQEVERHQRLYAALSQINQAVVRTHSKEELFSKVCDALVSDAGLEMAWIGWADPEQRRIKPVSVSGDLHGYLNGLLVLTDDSPNGAGPTGTAYKTGVPQVCNDMLAEASLQPWYGKIQKCGFRASAAFPIAGNGTHGVLNAYAGEAGFFQEKEVALLNEAATDVAFALQVFERERQRKELEAVAANENLFARAMMESMPGIIYFYRQNGRFLRWNKNFEYISGYSAEEIADMHPLDFFAETEKDLLSSRISEVFEHGESSVEAPFLTKKGKKIPYYFTGRRIEFDGGPCLIGTGVDISLLKKAEQQIMQLNAELEKRVMARTAELEAANKELEAFSYSVSHDLRAPLRAINGFAEIVLNKFGKLLPQDGYRYLQRIRNGGQRMGALIDDLLSFARLSRENLNIARIDTNQLVRSVVEELSSSIAGREVEIRIEPLATCYGDSRLLRQVWLNLLGNAIKYTRNQKQAIISVQSQQAGGLITYSVRDNGVGFNMSYAHKLFGVFQRLHREDEFEGTGVGLAIVQRVIHRHGGQVGAESEEGKGAVFWFTLSPTMEEM